MQIEKKISRNNYRNNISMFENVNVDYILSIRNTYCEGHLKYSYNTKTKGLIVFGDYHEVFISYRNNRQEKLERILGH